MSTLVNEPKKYFGGFTPERSDLIKELERIAETEDIRIIGPVVGELLYILARSVGARKILELGTANGYSALYLAQALTDSDSQLVTLEWDPVMADRARENIRKAGHQEKVEVKVGDAIELMGNMEGPFDFIFMDIEKEFYAPALPHCRRLLKVGGMLVADNVAYQEAGEFNRDLSASPYWRSVNLFSYLPGHTPNDDGLAFAIREK